jgi:riboflavin kinase/FMN adenylyltransferase
MNIKATAVALGMFDGVHIGHGKVIKKVLYRNLTPAVFTFKTLRNKEAIMPYAAKFARLRKLGIELIYSSDFDSVKDYSAEEFVREILVGKMDCKYVSCGTDFRFAKNAESTADDLTRICCEYGIEVSIAKHAEIDGLPVSSTRIRNAVREGNLALANRMLGYDMTYTLEVVEGQKLGRTLGTPTINQLLPTECVLPKFGVYKSVVSIGRVKNGKNVRNMKYSAISNIGVKPTVGGESALVETYIPEFSTDLYGQTISVSLQEFIREERKFSSLDELKAQIKLDIQEVTK